MNDIQELGRHLAVLQDQEIEDLRAADAARDRFLSAIPTRMVAAPLRHVPRAPMMGLAAAFAAIALLWFILPRTEASLTASVDGSSLTDVRGKALQAPADSDLPIAFSDGSRLHLRGGSRLIVTALSSSGAEATLEDGRVNVDVVHRDTTHWALRAGPYHVAVVGTRFELRWSPAEKRLAVRLREGRLLVSGGSLASPLPIEAGQVFTASRDTWHLGPESDLPEPFELGDAGAAIGSPTVASSGAPDPADPATANPAPEASVAAAPSAPASRPTFQSLAKEGKFGAAFEEAERIGFSNLCKHSSPRDLMTLAEAARFAKKDGPAREALLALRERFPGDNLASLSAFMLGRMAGPGEAARWFRSYLAESKDGALRREASGRLLEALWRSGQATEARDAARRYLSQYPRGPHAVLAERVLAP